MKVLYILMILLIVGDKYDNFYGVYSFRTKDYYESIELKENKLFKYNLKIGIFNQEVNGNYHIQGDTLYLNSLPQKDRIIVFEDYKKNTNKYIFDVYNKQKERIVYHLFIKTKDDQILEFRDSYGKIKVEAKNVKNFYLIDTKGIMSPVFSIVGDTNFFEVYFETSRVFEEESWIWKHNKILPRSFDGSFQNHYLKLIENK